MKSLPNELSQAVESHRWLIDTYFTDPEKRFVVKKGEALMRQGEYNDRLHLVLSGSFRGYTELPDGTKYETFKAVRHTFVGVSSFFSKTYICSSDVIATEDSEVAYIDQYQKAYYDGTTTSLSEQFMPVIVAELIHRQYRLQRIALEKERATEQLIRTEKMASLGQISAGIAHELNNAVAVIKRQGEWLSQYLDEIVQENNPETFAFYQQGKNHGRNISTREARKRTKELVKTHGLSEDTARALAGTNVSEDEITALGPQLENLAEPIVKTWEIGASLHDLQVAADHAIHVVRSIKNLGGQQSERKPGLDINACVEEALTLLTSPLRVIQIETNQKPLPPIIGNKGELVQMLINLVKNACEALQSAQTPNPLIRLETFTEENDIVIQVQDNGPGIPKDILPRIFEPRLTTKTGGQTVGLGLGLAIVQQLVDSYGGSVSAHSEPGDTTFIIRIPFGGHHGETQHSHRG